MIVTADQIVGHMLGDYVFQSDWMANTKTKQTFAALTHALVYGLCVWGWLLIAGEPEPSRAAMAVIIGTHLLIDRFRLARYLCWVKNLLCPPFETKPWAECSATGYHKDTPPFLSIWLMIIADNCAHVIINGLALKYL